MYQLTAGEAWGTMSNEAYFRIFALLIAFVCIEGCNLRTLLGGFTKRLHSMPFAAAFTMLCGEADLAEVVCAGRASHLGGLVCTRASLFSQHTSTGNI
jgi:hypothetical protein